jgi:hypothetical protein
MPWSGRGVPAEGRRATQGRESSYWREARKGANRRRKGRRREPATQDPLRPILAPSARGSPKTVREMALGQGRASARAGSGSKAGFGSRGSWQRSPLSSDSAWLARRRLHCRWSEPDFLDHATDGKSLGSMAECLGSLRGLQRHRRRFFVHTRRSALMRLCRWRRGDAAVHERWFGLGLVRVHHRRR